MRTPLLALVAASSRQATQKGREPKQVNTEVHIPNITLFSGIQRLTNSYFMRFNTCFLFCLIVTIILEILVTNILFLFLDPC